MSSPVEPPKDSVEHHRKFDRLYDMNKHLTTVNLATFGIILTVAPHLIGVGMQPVPLGRAFVGIAISGGTAIANMLYLSSAETPKKRPAAALTTFCWITYLLTIGNFLFALPAEYKQVFIHVLTH